MTTPVEQAIQEFLEFYPPHIVDQVEVLRGLVLRAVPDALERLRPGWKLIGYDLPITKRGTYFAWIWPQVEHVHIGWEVGTLLNDPRGLLGGADLNLKRVRYLTYEPGQRIATRVVIDFTRQAAHIVSMSRAERQLLAATPAASQSGSSA